MYDLRDYTDDEIDAELRALGIASTDDPSTFGKTMMISNGWDKIRSAVARRRQQRVEDAPRKIDVGCVETDLINAMVAASAMGKITVRELPHGVNKR